MTTKENLKSMVTVVASAALYGVSIKLFVDPINLLPAGFSGMSQLISLMLDKYVGFSVNFMHIYLFLQVITTTIVFKFIGRRFALLSVLQYVLATVISQLIPAYNFSEDAMLLTLFGGALCGLSSVLAISAGASTGGTDFIAVYVMNKRNMPIFNYILYANCLILILSGVLIKWDLAMYSIIFQIATTVIINNVRSRQKLISLTIVTEKADDLVGELHKITKHGITKINAKGTYSNCRKDVLYMVINEYESQEIVNKIKELDESVFIGIGQCERVVGKYSINPIT